MLAELAHLLCGLLDRLSMVIHTVITLFQIYLLLLLPAFYPTALKGCQVLFSPMVSGWAGGRREKVCPGCISETVRCMKLILDSEIG